mgnify:CR=1 FL=1
MSQKVVVLQPSFLPWLGYLDQYAWCDQFVIYDDVQYDKHGWRNRNRILTGQGPSWLTVPVRVKGQDFPLICEVEVDGLAWRRKHLQSIRQAYSKAPHFDWLFAQVEDYYANEWAKLLDWNVHGLRFLAKALGMPWKGRLSSDLGVPGRKTERLVGICRLLQATDYLTGDAAREYLDETQFAALGIRVHWHGYAHPVYRQRGKDFTPYLSVLDLMFWHGPGSFEILWQTGK